MLSVIYGGMVPPGKAQPDDHFDLTVLLILDNRQPLFPLSLSQNSSLYQRKRNYGKILTGPGGTSSQVKGRIQRRSSFPFNSKYNFCNTSKTMTQQNKCSSMLASPNYHFVHLYSPTLLLAEVSPYPDELLGVDSTSSSDPHLDPAPTLTQLLPWLQETAGSWGSDAQVLWQNPVLSLSLGF